MEKQSAKEEFESAQKRVDELEMYITNDIVEIFNISKVLSELYMNEADNEELMSAIESLCLKHSALEGLRSKLNELKLKLSVYRSLNDSGINFLSLN